MNPNDKQRSGSPLPLASGLDIWCFGCIGVAGHYLHTRKGQRYLQETPWGSKLDGGLLTEDYYRADTTPDGKWKVHHKDGWTAVSFWDRSGDERPGSNTTFVVNATMSGEELLAAASSRWPEVFFRPKFPVRVVQMSNE